MNQYDKYQKFLKSIDNDQAINSGFTGETLSERIEMSAEENAGDTFRENDEAINIQNHDDHEKYYEACLYNAEFIYDAWQDYYPELIK